MLFCVSSIFLLNISAGRPQAAKDNVSIEQFHPEISRATNDEGRASIPKHESALERGKRISTKISSQELFEAYRDLRKEYSNFAFNPGAVKSWSVIKESKDGIQISLLKHKDDPSCPYVRMEGVVDGSIQDVWGFLELKNWVCYETLFYKLSTRNKSQKISQSSHLHCRPYQIMNILSGLCEAKVYAKDGSILRRRIN